MASGPMPSEEDARLEALRRAEAALEVASSRLASAQRRLAMHESVSRVVAEAISVEEALPRVLQSICEAVGWDVGVCWEADEDAGVLRCAALWHAPDRPEQELGSLRPPPTLERGVGLAGRVWASGAPAWISDVSHDESFASTPWACQEGLHGAFASAVLLQENVLCVMEFMSRDVRPPDDEILGLVTALGTQIGQFVQRAKAEAELRETEERFAAFMDNNPAVAWMKDESSRYVYINRSHERLFLRTLEAVKGRTDADLWPEKTARRFHETDPVVLASGTPLTTTETIATPDGLIRDWTVVQFPFRSPTGPCYVGGLAIDVTEQARAQQALRETQERLLVLEEQVRSRVGFERMVGKSEPMQECFRRLRLAAQSDVTVVLAGESGAGKELAAGAIHSLSSRRDKPFLAVSCSALPETLLESELFGHVKGSFTGAIRDKVGLFQAAGGGTLFLDEVGDMSPLLQLKLLRVLQEREIRRVGDERSLKVDVRLVTASNKDLRQLLVSGALREDFYYRVRVFEIALPPLRERRDDIPLLVAHFIAELSRTRQTSVKGIAADALQRLMEHSWPGNVRELRNAIESALVTAPGDRIRMRDLPAEVRFQRAAAAPRGSVADPAERERIAKALAATGGRRADAAKLLGISRVTLWKKMRRLGIDADDHVDPATSA
jgi:PAS domain S-box-containing protein